jgi:hypothetical protein
MLETQVQVVTELLEEMRQLTIDAGVLAEKYDTLVSKITDENYDDTLAWLRMVRAIQYQGVLVVWRLVPERVWNMYEISGLQGLQEQERLTKRQKELRRVWNSRNPTSRAKKGTNAKETTTKSKNGQGDSNGVAVRSQGSGTDVDNHRTQ